MAKFKAKALVNGTETEVELDDEQFIPVDQHNTRMKKVIETRLARQATNIRGELLKDEGFRAEVFKAAGFDPSKPGKGGTEDLAKLQAEFRKTELEPVQQQLTQLQQTLQGERRGVLVSRLKAAYVEKGVKPAVAGRLAELDADKFGYDDASKDWAVRKGDGFAFARNVTDERPYKGVEEFAEDFVADKANADFVVVQKQTGPNTNGREAPAAGSVRSRADLRTVADKSAFIEKHGLDAYTALPAKSE